MPVPHPSGKGPDITVWNESEQTNSDYVMRVLEVTRETDEKRKIYHFQFKSWPDHGVPKDPGMACENLPRVRDRLPLSAPDSLVL